jgi:hypothetical protein
MYKSIIKRCAFGLSAVVLLALGYHSAGWVVALGNTAPEGPALAVERTGCDFGTVRPGETREAVFVVSNRGRQRVILRKLNGGCNCLMPREPEMLIPPGRSRRIELTFNADGMDGKVEVETRYRTSDPAHPVLTLTCSADVQPATTTDR